ncbi:hypothetical protein BC940DRAFT_309866 [Gongronella butleri]|nr:hypothetical protein BC940DRAFT_309866 [Gongronella butleri]
MSRGTSMATNSKFFLLSDDEDDDDDDDDGEANGDDDDGDDAHPLHGQTCVDSHMMLYAVDEGDDDTLHDADESLHGDDCTVFDDEFDEFGDQDHDDDVIDLFSKRTDQLHAERRPSLLSTMLRVASLSSSSSLSSISPPPSTSNSRWSPADAPPCFQRAMSPPVHPLAPIQAELDLSSSLRQCVDWEQQQNRRWGPLDSSVHHPIPLAGSMDPTMAW